MTERSFAAEDGELSNFLTFAEKELEKVGCPIKSVMSITVALEEVFVNVAHYAYPDRSGSVNFSIDYDSESRQMIFQISDSGIPFDPLAKPDPDITLSAEERQVGGLGIFMMKMTMDDVKYAYTDGQNVLTMKKFI